MIALLIQVIEIKLNYFKVNAGISNLNALQQISQTVNGVLILQYA